MNDPIGMLFHVFTDEEQLWIQWERMRKSSSSGKEFVDC